MATGCYQNENDDTKHPIFIKAMNEKHAGNYLRSEKLLNDFLKINPLSAKAQLELAYLYQDNLDNPIKAAYHYSRYLEINPNSPDKDDIQALLEASEKKLLENLFKKNKSKLYYKILQYEKELKALKTENAELKSQLEKLIKISEIQLSQNEEQQKKDNQNLAIQNQKKQSPLDEKLPPPTIPEFYIVEQGDTLSKISRKLFGTTKYFRLIYQENKDILSSEDAHLYVGQKLKIPKID